MLKFQFAKLDGEGAGNIIMDPVVLKVMASHCLEFYILAANKNDLIKKKDNKLRKYFDKKDNDQSDRPVNYVIFTGKEFTLTCSMQLPVEVDSRSAAVNSDRAFITFYIIPPKSDFPEHLTLLTLDKNLDYTPMSTVIYGMTAGKCIRSELAPENESIHYFSQELYNGIASKYKRARKKLLKNI